MKSAKVIAIKPEAAPCNEAVVATCFADKRAVAAMAGLKSTSWVEMEMAKGMPHLKLVPRRVRFDLAEVREWPKEKYHQQRRAVAA
jgi:hypothetical protein